MNRRCFLLMVALFSSLLLVYGCGEDDDGGGQSAQQLINQGWAKFGAGDHAGASADFNAALGLDPQAYEAYFALGWAELRMSHAGLAQNAFETYLDSVSSGSNIPDAKAGLALAYHAQDMFNDAIDAAEEVLGANPTWSFSRAPSIDYQDLALILAQSYYEIGDFDQSLQAVRDFLDPAFSADTSTPEGRKQLADKLEDLFTG